MQQCLDDVASESAQPKRSCSPEAMELLASARWPGNVRQLRMVVRQAAATGAGAVITADQVQEAQGQITQLPSFDEARELVSPRLQPVLKALLEAGAITAIAMNGSAAIHDFEVSLIGATSEDVGAVSVVEGNVTLAAGTSFTTLATRAPSRPTSRMSFRGERGSRRSCRTESE